MKYFTFAIAAFASALLISSVAVADPIGGVNDSVAFCAAPIGGPAAVADSSCDGCGCKGDKSEKSKSDKSKSDSDKGSCGCGDKDKKSSCGGGEEASLDEFLGGLDRVDYACGCTSR